MAFNILINSGIERATEENNPALLEKYYQFKGAFERLKLEGLSDIEIKDAIVQLYGHIHLEYSEVIEPNELTEMLKPIPTLGLQIKRARNVRNFTQRELADLAGISYTYICLLESGQRKNPSFIAMKNLSSALNVPIDSFRTDDLEG